MSRRNRSHAARSTVSTPVTQSNPTEPSIESLLDDVIRRGARGDRAAIGRIASIFGSLMTDHAAEHLGRFDADDEDVRQDVLLAMLEGKLRPPSEDQSAVQWLLDVVESFARGERKAAARRWGLEDDGDEDE